MINTKMSIEKTLLVFLQPQSTTRGTVMESQWEKRLQISKYYLVTWQAANIQFKMVDIFS